MGPWGDAKVFVYILFMICYFTVTVAQMPSDCCLDVKNKEVEKAAFADYKLQISGHGCAIDAMVQQKMLCVPHNEPWVKRIVKHVDNLKKFCKKHNYQPKRCHGVKRE